MPATPFDRYVRYDELVSLLKAYLAEFPKLCSLTSIGKSHEGRDIWLATLTNTDTGPAHEKPAFWCDGNIHASEVSASSAVLHVIHTLTGKYGTDEAVTRAMDTRAFYLVPRLGPDGAEWALADKPKIVRSGTRPYPYDEEDHYGLERQDIDGDGRILSMRVKDPNGPWKICESEPRLMEKRAPGDTGGQYYRLLAEGLFHNFDNMTMQGHKMPQGLDFNRNFPSGWRQENDQYGAGPYPTSEPEIRAAVQAIVDRPNICGAVTFHTFSGVHLRPPSRMPDDDIPPEDLWAFKTIGAKGEEMTGYPAISNYHEFRYHPKEVITGVFDDWMYEHRGVFAWTTEIWSPQRQAGITDYKYIDWFRDHPIEHDKKLLVWSDEKLGGRGYLPWTKFEHPQLGEVEIGGWDPMLVWRNPPPEFLEKEIAPMSDWVVWQALCSPRLELREVKVDALEPGMTRIRVAVMNSGWLPTNVTKVAADKKLCRGVVGEISKAGVKDGGPGSKEPDWLVSGLLREVGQNLVGWSHVPSGGFGWQMDPTNDVQVFTWVVRGSGKFEVVVKHERAGVVRTVIEV